MQQPPNNPGWQGMPQYPQYPQQPPPFPPRRPRRTLLQWYRAQTPFGKVAVIFAAIFVLSAGIYGVATDNTVTGATTQTPSATSAPQATATTAPTIQPTVKPTTQPTNAPTAKPTTGLGNLSATFGTPLLGGQITDFIGKFGPPISTCPPYSLCWFKDSSTNAAGLIVGEHLDASGKTTTNGGFTAQVDSLTVQTINGQIWDSSTAADSCTVYSPLDAHQGKRIPLVNASGQASGFDVVYVSASLAGEFTPGDFVDSSQNTVQPGTFDIQYLYKGDGTQNIDSCSILIGEQQTQ